MTGHHHHHAHPAHNRNWRYRFGIALNLAFVGIGHAALPIESSHIDDCPSGNCP